MAQEALGRGAGNQTGETIAVPSLPIPKVKERRPWSKKMKLALAGTAIAAILSGSYGIYQAIQPDKPAIVAPAGETLPPRFPSSNWLVIPQKEIRNYAKAPQIQILDKNTSISTVSPILQEKAKAAGYTIIYQGDPNDTTGRTVFSTDRNTDPSNYPINDGFGEMGISIQGVFKAWVPKPSDPQQQNDVYALLENPLTKKTYLVDISLRKYLPFQTYATDFAVDNLDRGYADVVKMEKTTGSGLGTIGLPDDPNDPSKLCKSVDDFPSFNYLLVKKGVNLDNIAQPGDYVSVWKQFATTPVDENGIARTSLFIVRRFGGTAAWEKEVGIK